ncbi:MULTISPECIES: serine/threonine-protein kinase [unclassified Pseudofrankia]|uniref:protein kinase domain-containing protein n=1 Tax=unclassified Pseudofrankia TaxID=2994372 RepID=UPI0008DB282B|nr:MULTISPECIES: serine/threonine-protein kinase [unclassified Pseudofrankia]MDT3445723.1 protein kinase [Pseudofrankia sp. BMG5.37]OHV42470.1 hypothetical protein BCD48_31325 [Pseudofrankia sp. BMG5.36]
MSIDPGRTDADETKPPAPAPVDGTPAPAVPVPRPAAAPVGFTLGDLQVGELLGRGSTGEVRRAVGPDGETVAVKLLRPELADEPQVVARLLQECKVVARIADPHVVRIRRLVAEGDRVGIVMDYLPDGDLRALLRREGTLPPADAARLAAQVLLGLRRAHEAGVVHRDVKPENVLLRGRDVVLTDFGIARQLEGPALTRSTGLLGTPAYLAPELASHEPATPAVDVYSTGCLCYELLTGAPPFVGGPAVTVLLRHLNEPPARPDGLPDPLWAALAAMLAKQPHLRPTAGDAAAALAALAPALAGLPARPRTPPAPTGPTGTTPRLNTEPGPGSAGSSSSATTASPSPDSGQDPTPDLTATRTSGPRHPYAPTGPAAPDPSYFGAFAFPPGSGPDSGPSSGPGAAGPGTDGFDAFATHTSAPRPGAGSPGGPNRPDPDAPGRPGRGFPRRAAVLIPVAVVLVLALAGTGLTVLLRHSRHADLAGDTAELTATAPAGATGTGGLAAPSAATPLLGASATPTSPRTSIGSGASSGSTTTPTATATAAPVPAPGRPSVTAAPRSGAVVLTISRPSGGGQVTGYRIRGSGISTRNASSAGQVTVPVPDCDTHAFTVTAVGPGGSADSAVVNAVGCVAPGPVTGVVASVDQLANDGSGLVTVRWSAPADFGGASSVDYVLTITPSYPEYPQYTTTSAGTTHTHCMPAGRCPEHVTAIQARNSMGLGPRVEVPSY